jgi:hypothetical protein
MKYIVKNNKIRIIAHILFFLFGTLYILAGQLSIDWLTIFKAFPLTMLFILVIPSSTDITIIKSILGVACGIIGDYIL